MGQSIEYQKLMTEIVYINLPGPEQPDPRMSGGELFHGFLADLHRAPSSPITDYVSALSEKWHVYYREGGG